MLLCHGISKLCPAGFLLVSLFVFVRIFPSLQTASVVSSHVYTRFNPLPLEFVSLVVWQLSACAHSDRGGSARA